MQNERLTERQTREREFYNTFRKSHQVEQVDFDYVFDGVPRPHNAYWSIYDAARAHFATCLSGSTPPQLLDFGCGAGEASVRFARMGYHVTGFDISEANIENSRLLAERYELTALTTFAIDIAESLSIADNSFDFVAGIDILHHIEIPRAMAEVRRVLKPGGIAVFKEQIEVPLFDSVRNWSLVERFFPKQMSYDLHITQDEKKLSPADVQCIRSLFPGCREERFSISARFVRLLPGSPQQALGRLQRFDHKLKQLVPVLGAFGGEVVFHLRKPTADSLR